MLAIQTNCYRPDIAIPWATDAVKHIPDSDSSNLPAKLAYLEFEKTTQDFTHGWCQHIIKDAQSNYCYYLDMFGPDATEESIFHLYYIHREKHLREFARPWATWVAEYRTQHNITATQQIVQISNPIVGSKSSACCSYPL
jgi:hypothetical protein